MTTPNILQGQIAIDPNNGILFYKNNSNTLVNTTLHWSQYDGITTSTSDDVRLEANLTIDGNLIVNGSQTAVQSTTVYVKDPVFTLGGNTNPTSDDNKDRGIEFRWHNGSTAKLGFFGFDDSTGKFTFIPDATNTSEVYSGTSGELSAKVDWSNIINKDTFVNSLTGTANEIEVSSNTGNVTLSLPATINANTTGTASALTNARTISLSGDVTGSVSFNGSSNVDISTTIAINSLVLGTDTTGDYVQSLVAGTGITLANNSGESATPTVSVTTNTFDAYGAAATAATNAATALTNHEADTTNIHGIADTSILVTTTGTQTLTNKTITTPAGLVKGDVGLGNVDNTSDANKPVSTAGQTALDLKANLASPTFTGSVGMSVLYVDGIEIDPTGALNTQVLKYNSSTNKFVPGVASIVANIVDLTDVQITSPVNNQVLKYSSVSEKWVNATPAGGSGSGGLTYSANIGDNVNNTYVLTHNFGTRDVVVVVRNNISPYEVISAGWESTTENAVTLDFSAPVTSNAFRVSVFAAVTGDGYEPVPGPAMAFLNDAGDVTITSAADGDFLRWNGTAWINDAVNLSTDTIGSFVQSLVAGTGITLANNSGENATPTITVDTTVIQAVVANVSNTEIGYLDGVTSAIQTQIDTKAPLASPTFTGTVTVPDNSFALGTKTTGDYVATITGGTGVSSTASTSGEGTTHTLSIGQAVGTADNVTFAGLTADAITIGVTSAGEIDTTSGNLTIDSIGGTVTVDDNLIVTGNATINNNLIVTGNITINGNTTTLNTETITVEDKTIELGSSASPSNTTANGAGIIVPDGAANKSFTWSSSSLAWSSSEDLNLVSGKVLKINGTEVLSATNYTGQAATVAANSVTATTLQEGVPRAGFRSQLNAQTGTSYTLQLTDLAKLVTMDNGSTMTLTVPANSSVSFQIGDRIDILRKGSGELTIGYPVGVVINGTPGLKLRAQWSSATLVKLDTDTWVALGDLKV
jgi:cytoskeletal protein CcmA (bactofilin family)